MKTLYIVMQENGSDYPASVAYIATSYERAVEVGNGLSGFYIEEYEAADIDAD